MRKEYVLEAIKEDKEFIYNTCYIFDEDSSKGLFNHMIKMFYKKSWKLKNENEINDWCESIIALCIVEKIDKEKIKLTLEKYDISIIDNDENKIFELLKGNISDIEIDDSDLNINDEYREIENIIDEKFKYIKKKFAITNIAISLFFIIFLSIGSFLLVPHIAYQITPFGNFFNKLHIRVFEKERTFESKVHDGSAFTIEKPKSRLETIDTIHEMSNSIIIAKNNNEKWGITEITPENIEIVIQAAIEYLNDEEILSMLDKWRVGDFYNATVVHNYVWTMLNGNVGYAVAIDEEKIDYLVEKYETYFSK